MYLDGTTVGSEHERMTFSIGVHLMTKQAFHWNFSETIGLTHESDMGCSWCFIGAAFKASPSAAVMSMSLVDKRGNNAGSRQGASQGF